MAKKGSRTTLVTLVLTIVLIMAALMHEAAENPSFRAADYDSLEECLQEIPAAWPSGSIERTGAETACRHTHSPQKEARS